MITLGQHKGDNNNQMIQLTEVLSAMFVNIMKQKNVMTIRDWFYYPWSN